MRADKEREAGDGHDGTWVAHPDLVPVAMEIFDRLMPAPNQLDRQREDVTRRPRRTCSRSTTGARTEAGLRENIRVGVQYIEAWLARPRRGAALQPDGGRRDRRDQPRADLAVAPLRRRARRRPQGDARAVREVLAEEMERVREHRPTAYDGGRFPEAIELFTADPRRRILRPS